MTVQTDPALATHADPAPDPSSDRLVGRLTTFASLATVLLIMARVTKHAADPLDNSDTWFHLRLGQDFLGGWSLWHPGQLSKFATTPWVPTQWSTEMLTAKMDDWFGLPGVAWLFGALFLVFIVTLFLLCQREGDVLPAAVATGVTVIAAGASLSARPQVVSLILFTLTVAAWHRAARTGIPPWWLIPLTWVWATAHGMWTAGVLAGLVTWLGLALDRRHDARTSVRFLAVPVLSVLAACVTPLGPRLLVSQVAVGERTSLITEWGPTSFRTLTAFLVAAMVGVVVIRWSRRSEVAWTPLLQLVLAGGWILLVSRMVPFGAILAAPLFVVAVTEILPRRTQAASQGRAARRVVWGGALLCLVALTVAVPHTAAEPGGVPSAFTSRLQQLPDGASVLVEDGTGAWIEYEFPALNPVIDGMLDAYPVDHIQAFADFRNLEPGWTDFVDESDADVAVLEKGSALTAAMQAQLGWKVVQKDRDWVYLEAPDTRP